MGASLPLGGLIFEEKFLVVSRGLIFVKEAYTRDFMVYYWQLVKKLLRRKVSKRASL